MAVDGYLRRIRSLESAVPPRDEMQEARERVLRHIAAEDRPVIMNTLERVLYHLGKAPQFGWPGGWQPPDLSLNPITREELARVDELLERASAAAGLERPFSLFRS